MVRTRNRFNSIVTFQLFLAEYLIRSDNHQGHSQATFLDFPTFTDRFTSIQMPEQ